MASRENSRATSRSDLGDLKSRYLRYGRLHHLMEPSNAPGWTPHGAFTSEDRTRDFTDGDELLYLKQLWRRAISMPGQPTDASPKPLSKRRLVTRGAELRQ